ncbi:hypothetical protein Cgig2_027473 [Carnegiea gigantea]|uniref:Uncharacterized protein n=1 Tax=Carnegiea gigantea TaxID=171969 RepID=A0A9Q1KPK5_9CARY|nr:hypothetical protein Cgig2_027473 [Carnegiea gigantea]
MAFPRSLDTKAMAEYVTRHFVWDRRGVAFPSSPLPKDFQALYPNFELAVANEAAEYYELPELPQVIFYAMLLDETERLGVVQGRALRSLESALVELRWSTFESWVWLYSDRIFEAQFRLMAGSGESSRVRRPGEGSERDGRLREGVLCLALEESFASASSPSQRLLRPMPTLSLSEGEGEGAAADFEFPEMPSSWAWCTVFTEGLKSALVGLRWSTFEVWMSCVNHVLRVAQLQQPVDEVEVCGLLDGQGEGSGSNGSPARSNDQG